MLSESDLSRIMGRLRRAAEHRGAELPGYASDAALLLADAAEELGASLRLDQREPFAVAMLEFANEIRALAPVLAAI